MEKVNVKLTDYQKSKIKSAFKKNNNVNIQFDIYQFKSDGNDVLLLTKRQFNKLKKHLKANTGLRLEFSFNQLKQIKNGGLLKEILDVADYIPIVNQFTPKVRKGAKYVKENISPKIRNFIDWLDNELSNVQGSGLDEKTIKYIKQNYKKNFNH